MIHEILLNCCIATAIFLFLAASRLLLVAANDLKNSKNQDDDQLFETHQIAAMAQSIDVLTERLNCLEDFTQKQVGVITPVEMPRERKRRKVVEDVKVVCPNCRKVHSNLRPEKVSIEDDRSVSFHTCPSCSVTFQIEQLDPSTGH